MRYIAILKDSLREAWDSWVLLALLVVSTLVILFIGQLSFKPLTAEKTMAYFFPLHPFQPPIISAMLNERSPEKIIARQGRWGNFRLQDVQLVRGDADSPLSEYSLTVVAESKFPGPQFGPPDDNAQQAKKEEVDVKAEIKQLRSLFEDAENLNYIKINSTEPIAKGDDEKGPSKYRVVVEGTAKTHRIWATELGVLFGAYPLRFLEAPLSYRLWWLASWVIGIGSWISMLLGIVITSFFIPNMLRKGTIDLLLAKPISRWLLLIYKYLGGLTFVFLTSGFAIGGIWLVLGLRSGLWATGALLLIPTMTFFFAILYSISTFVSVITRSVVTSILVTVFAYGVLALIGFSYSGVDLLERFEVEDAKMRKAMGRAERPADEIWTGHWSLTAVKVVHAISPRTEDVNQINNLIIYTDFLTGNMGDMSKFDTSNRNWWETILVSSIWIAIFLGLATLWFYFKDY